MKTKQKYIGLGLVLGIGMGAVIGGSLWAGMLDPPSSAVSNDTPTSTMRPLDELHGAWSQKFSCETQQSCERFISVLDDEAVVDKETGLMWERSPDPGLQAWQGSLGVCYGRQVAGRKGWRLPTIEELLSLGEFSNGSNQFPPAGHPFTLGNTLQFRSATTIGDSATWTVIRSSSESDPGTISTVSMVIPLSAWCVRGGHGSSHHEGTTSILG